MSQKRKPAKAAKAAKKTPAKKAPTKKPKKITAYIVVREIASETPTFTEPDRLFVNKGDAMKFADERNRELRALVNPFHYNDPDNSMKGGEKAFITLVKKLNLPVPQKDKDYNYFDWQEWWDRHFFDMTNEQRETIWDAQEKYDWYKVKTTTVEG